MLSVMQQRDQKVLYGGGGTAAGCGPDGATLDQPQTRIMIQVSLGAPGAPTRDRTASFIEASKVFESKMF